MSWCLVQLRYHQFAYLDLGPKHRMQKLDWKNLEDDKTNVKLMQLQRCHHFLHIIAVSALLA